MFSYPPSPPLLPFFGYVRSKKERIRPYAYTYLYAGERVLTLRRHHEVTSSPYPTWLTSCCKWYPRLRKEKKKGKDGKPVCMFYLFSLTT